MAGVRHGKFGSDNMGFWEDRNVMVTGADGFVGSWLAMKLIEKGANVITITRDLKKDANFKLMGIENKMTIVHADLVDYDKVARAINQFSVNTCFHLAAQAIVQFANHSPVPTFESNIRGTWNLLEACRLARNMERVVVASSDKAYGAQNKLPYTEKSPLLGSYPYDASKACADILARSYHFTYDLPIAVTRNANTYGGGDLNFSRLVPDAIQCLLKKKQFVIRSDGTFKRDYMYVKDAVDAYLTLAENLHRRDVRGEAFNFGTGSPVTVLELFKILSDLTGSNIKPKILNQARNEIRDQYLSTEKVAKFFKWKPRYSLENGLKETLVWYKNYLK
jgi:CDP-glucose 4,6-dehydratase